MLFVDGLKAFVIAIVYGIVLLFLAFAVFVQVTVSPGTGGT